jgi:hypothetical protein
LPSELPGSTIPTAVLQSAPGAVFSAPRFDSAWFYLVLVLVSVVALGSTVVARKSVPQLLPDPQAGA